MNKKADERMREIEETQDALRRSIAEASHLADKAQQLLTKHKKAGEEESRQG